LIGPCRGAQTRRGDMVLALALLCRSHLVARCACSLWERRLWSGDQAPAHMGGLQCSSWNVGAKTDSMCSGFDLSSTHWLDINCVVCYCNVRAMCLQWQGYLEGMESMAQGIAIPRQGHGKSPLRLCHAHTMSRARQERGHIKAMA
jgi:hypothetical protein